MNPYDSGAREVPALFVIFGGLGDLSQRKLIPALYALHRDQKLAGELGIVLVDLKPLEEEAFHTLLWESMEKYTGKSPEEAQWQSFCQRLHYLATNLNTDVAAYETLKKYLEELDVEHGSQGNRIFYMAVNPSLFSVIVQDLHGAGMLENRQEEGAPWQRVMVEKPFGRSLESARELHDALAGMIPEEKIFRIDHYLGKEMLQNILAIRFSNTIFEALWNHQYIDHIQIHASEEIGIESRGAYYEQSGILRDMLQNHILQMLALVCMEPPVRLEAEHIRNEKVKVLQSIRMEPDSVLTRQIVTGQYGPGIKAETGDGASSDIAGYRQEPGVAEDSRTPTFIALKLHIDNFRWAGVPVYIRSGKRMKKRESVIVIVFKKLPGLAAYPMFDKLHANTLVIKIQPNEGMALQFNAKTPGNEFLVDKVDMDYCQACRFIHNSPEAYERLILGAMRNNKSLFTRWDELENAWRFTDHLQKYLENRKPPYPNYAAGTDGPEEAEYLISRDGRQWWGN